MKKIYVLICILTLTLLGGCRTTQETSAVPESVTSEAIVAETTTPDAIDILMQDLDIPEEYHGTYRYAIGGNGTSQESLCEMDYDNGQTRDFPRAIFDYDYYRYSGITEAECHYRIAELYYEGWTYSQDAFPTDKPKAFLWFMSAFEKRHALSGLMAGDMLIKGDGIRTDRGQAFELYSRALLLEPSTEAYLRLGDCYYDGAGTAVNKDKAFEMYLNGALRKGSDPMERILERYSLQGRDLMLQKSIGSAIYPYPDLYIEAPKIPEVLNQLREAWIEAKDPAAKTIRAKKSSNRWFSSAFIEQIKQAMYSYSFYEFAKENEVLENASQGSVTFAIDEENELNIEKWGFINPNGAGFGLGTGYYIYDFDKDGKDELYAPYHTGAGGLYSGNPITVLEKDKSGKYDMASQLDGYSHRDNLFLTKIDGNYYFTVNSVSDSGYEVYDIDVLCYGNDRKLHMARFACADFMPQSVIADTDEAYIKENSLEALMDIVKMQAKDAIAASRQSLLYSPPEEEGIISTYEMKDWWYGWQEGEAKDVLIRSTRQFGANYIKKGHYASNQGKYYFDVTSVDLFNDEEEAATSKPIYLAGYENYDFPGHVSRGNVYDYLPIDGGISQFWTIDYEDETYTIALTRDNSLYTLYVFLMEGYLYKGMEVKTIHRELFLDEFNSIKVTFENL